MLYFVQNLTPPPRNLRYGLTVTAQTTFVHSSVEYPSMLLPRTLPTWLNSTSPRWKCTGYVKRFGFVTLYDILPSFDCTEKSSETISSSRRDGIIHRCFFPCFWNTRGGTIVPGIIEKTLLTSFPPSSLSMDAKFPRLIPPPPFQQCWDHASITSMGENPTGIVSSTVKVNKYPYSSSTYATKFCVAVANCDAVHDSQKDDFVVSFVVVVETSRLDMMR
mmetsp:Transcript_20440/g.48595  ORF Transcript_20440/g.48595 Transcript_20440/m.48595 type:complete len:219 (+) Transcript_20440:344-1000(+)